MTATAPKAPPAGFAYNLPDLQHAAQEKFGLSRRDVLAIATGLYARGLITYPRTEDRELPDNMFDMTSNLVRDYKLVSGDRDHDPEQRSCGWVEALSGSHHGITLTAMSAAAVFGSLEWTEQDTQVYSLVRDRILSMFKSG